MNKYLLFTVVFLMITFNSTSQIVYVKQNATGLNDGTSWQNAYTNLSTAINSTSDGQIWVTAGTYFPTTDLNGKIPINPRLNTFKLKANIAIYGGFSGVETNINQRNWINHPTILSGNIGDVNVIQDNILHVLSCEYEQLTVSTILDGLTIKNGYSMSLDGGDIGNGGGIYVFQTSGGSFQIKNCIIEENYAEGYGGGLYISNNNPIIENSIFRNNASYSAGAMYLIYGKVIVSNCQIYNNYATGNALHWGEGGGIYLASYSEIKIFNCFISDNNAAYKGGGMYNNSNYKCTFNNNILSGNRSRDGGALFLNGESYVFNNLFADNSATSNGGAIFMAYGGNGQFINNTVVQNTAGTSGGGLYTFGPAPNITNSIFYSNSSPLGPQIRTYNNAGNWAPIFRYCNIEGGLANLASFGNPIDYQNNLDVNPLFTNTTDNNFRLQANSALINAGNSTIFSSSWPGSNMPIIYFPNTDLDGNQRIVGTIDIGAYEDISTLGIYSIDNFSFSIFPNPANGIFNITSNTDYDSLSVYNILGIKLFETFSESRITNIDLTSYASGLYFVHFSINDKIYIYKIIKK